MNKQDYKRILLVRTDRLGDLLLTTPAIKAVRKAYPEAYIAMIVRPYTEDVVKKNPDLNEVIIYDKYGKDKSLSASVNFAMRLKKKNFDIAIIFHPTNRMHIITYLAKIPRRIGYDTNFAFLLTDRIDNKKHEGKKHERDYTLDILKTLGIDPEDKNLYMPIDDKAVDFINNLFLEHGIQKGDKIVALHPGASCLSKIWPSERFAKVADRLIKDHKVKLIVLGGDDKKDIFCLDSVKNFMQQDAIFLKGNLGVSQLAALLKKVELFISNDSGPVHIAVAVGTPVISIFGRSQAGLSPKRWGPLGPNDIILHKDVGCGPDCLAHDCRRGFDCLKAISADEVYNAAEKLLK